MVAEIQGKLDEGGDRNTSFFQRIASGKRSRNAIDEILDGQGVLCSDEDEVR